MAERGQPLDEEWVKPLGELHALTIDKLFSVHER